MIGENPKAARPKAPAKETLKPGKDEKIVTCMSNNLYLGDGRKLLEGESAVVSNDIAADLKDCKNVKIG